MARAKIRQNRRAIGGWFPPETYRRMRLLGAGHDLTIQQLLTEALDDLLHKYADAGKSPSTVNNEFQADRDRLARECGALQLRAISNVEMRTKIKGIPTSVNSINEEPVSHFVPPVIAALTSSEPSGSASGVR